MTIPKEEEVTTRIGLTKGKAYQRLSPITLGAITRMLRTVRGLKGKAFVVGGLVTEGSTLRDIDIVLTNVNDISKLKKALGKYSKRAHFMIQKKEPPATEFYDIKKRYIKVTGKEGTSPDLHKGKGRIPKNEYAL